MVMRSLTFNNFKCLIYIIALSLTFTSCQKDVDLDVSSNVDVAPTAQQKNRDLLNDEEIKEQALYFYSKFSDDKLRSTKIPKVKNIIRDNTLNELRSGDSKDLNRGIVIVNFEDNAGFAIMSESRYGEPLLAISTEGSLPHNYKDNKDISFFIDMTKAYSYYPDQGQCFCGERFSDKSDYPFISDDEFYKNYCTPNSCKLEKIEDPYDENYTEIYDDSTREVTENIKREVVKPKLKVNWGQSEPYNIVASKKEGKRVPVGCVAVAVGQIMSHYKYPILDWDRLYKGDITDSYFKENIPQLLSDLGDEDLLNMHYKEKGSGASSYNVPRTLQSYGYKCSDVVDYNENDIMNELRQDRVVYISGYSKMKNEFKDGKIGDFLGYKGGHAWVIDGFKSIKQKRLLIRDITYKNIAHFYTRSYVVKERTETKTYFSCNYGWSGKANGFYLSRIFNANRNGDPKPVINKEEGTITKGQRYDYRYNFKIIKNIER